MIPDPRPPTPAELFDLTGQVALVTGASRGLGWAMAQTLAGAGATVVLNGETLALSRNEGTLSAPAASLPMFRHSIFWTMMRLLPPLQPLPTDMVGSTC